MNLPGHWTRWPASTCLKHLVRVAREHGTAVMLVTHDATVAAYADREVSLRDGPARPVRPGPDRSGGDRVRLATLAALSVSGSRTDRVRVGPHRLRRRRRHARLASAPATVAAIGPVGGRRDRGSLTPRPCSPNPAAARRDHHLHAASTIPVLALLGQCARLGAPAPRPPHRPAVRLAGANAPAGGLAIGGRVRARPASALGSVLGLAVLSRPAPAARHTGRERPAARCPLTVFPSAARHRDRGPSRCRCLVGLVATWMLRGVTTTPLGVVRRFRRRRSPGPWAGVLLLSGIGPARGCGSRRSTRYVRHHGTGGSCPTSVINRIRLPRGPSPPGWASRSAQAGWPLPAR